MGGQGVARQPVSTTVFLFEYGLFPETFIFETIAYLSVVDAQELGHTSGRIDEIRLSFGTLLVEKLKDGIILLLKLKQDRHDYKESLSEVRRTAFAAGLAV